MGGLWLRELCGLRIVTPHPAVKSGAALQHHLASKGPDERRGYELHLEESRTSAREA